MTTWRQTIEDRLGLKIKSARSLSGGDSADVYRLSFNGPPDAVAKVPKAGQPNTTVIEAKMLNALQATEVVPVPAVLYVDDQVLLIRYVESGDVLAGAAQEHLARIMAALHGVEGHRFGYAFDTVIGPLRQSNQESDHWVTFFADQRLRAMTAEAIKAGRLPEGWRDRMEALIEKLPTFLQEPDAPSLVHGDLWGGNILVKGSRVTGLIDPAIYFGHPEVDLAFGCLFNDLDEAFFTEYRRISPIKDGFFEERRDIYNLWPLLVHSRLFGGHYQNKIDSILKKHGC